MKKYIITLNTILLLFSINSLSQTAANEHDTQFWNETSVSFSLYKSKDKNGKETERLSGFVSGNLRIGQNVRHFVDERIGFGIDYKINKYFSFSPSYLYRAGQPTKNKKEFEHRLRFDLTAEKKWKNFSLKDRNRIEYRIRNSKDDTTRYRNKIQLKVPVIYGDGKELFAPFAANEFYYDFRQDSWFRNEFSIGVSRKVNKSTSADIYYMRQANKNVTTLKNLDIIGLTLKFKIS
jgi:hypothetical protein